MNQLPGIIKEVTTEGQLSIAHIETAGQMFKAIVIDTPETAFYLRQGHSVWMMFKENEVVIAKSFSGLISLQNRFESTITGLEIGKLLCKVSMIFGQYKIESIITANAAIELSLAVGDNVTAMVKTNEISLAPND